MYGTRSDEMATERQPSVTDALLPLAALALTATLIIVVVKQKPARSTSEAYSRGYNARANSEIESTLWSAALKG